MARIERCTPWSDRVATTCRCPLSTDDHLTLVDETGRIIARGKRGVILAQLQPMLARLELDVERWVDAMVGGGRFLGAAIGSAMARAAEAVRRGVRWVADQARVHRPPARLRA